MRPATRISSRLRPLITPGRTLLVQQFARFGAVGVVGAIVDIATVYTAMGTLGLYAAGILAYFTAVTTTWALNRAWTFAGRGGGSLVRQWTLFVAANGVGFVLNRGTFVLLVLMVPACAQHPVVAILAGVGAGMFANFSLSRRVVFRSQPPAAAQQLKTAERPAVMASE